MADETRTDPAPGVHAVPMTGGTARDARAAETNATRRDTPSPTGSSLNDDPEAARAEIEQTRRRMSTTIDELEGALLRRKGQIQERLNLLAPVREHPLRTAGIVFGVGLALGLLTGGGDEEEHHEDRHAEGDLRWRERSGMWESRARRLLRIAREQDGELDELRASRGRAGRGSPRRVRFAGEHDHGHRHDHRHAADESPFDGLRDSIASGVSGFLSATLSQLTHAARD